MHIMDFKSNGAPCAFSNPAGCAMCDGALHIYSISSSHDNIVSSSLDNSVSSWYDNIVSHSYGDNSPNSQCCYYMTIMYFFHIAFKLSDAPPPMDKVCNSTSLFYKWLPLNELFQTYFFLPYLPPPFPPSIGNGKAKHAFQIIYDLDFPIFGSMVIKDNANNGTKMSPFWQIITSSITWQKCLPITSLLYVYLIRQLCIGIAPQDILCFMFKF